MYRLQWAFIKDVNGKNIDPKNFEYHDTSFEYEDRDEALEDRITLMAQVTDKYIRVVKVYE